MATFKAQLYFDPNGMHSGYTGCYRARLVGRDTIHDAGHSTDQCIHNFYLTLKSLVTVTSGDVIEFHVKGETFGHFNNQNETGMAFKKYNC